MWMAGLYGPGHLGPVSLLHVNLQAIWGLGSWGGLMDVRVHIQTAAGASGAQVDGSSMNRQT